MMKKFVPLVLLATALVVGGYTAWTNWISPHPALLAESIPSESNSAPAADTPGSLPQPTIVAAVLNKDGIPETLGSLALTKSQIGTDVLSEFEKLHGASIDLKTGYRADYGDASASATLWVGQAQSADAAQKLVDDMAVKIDAGNPMFSNLKDLSIANHKLYEASGQGQLHFFYASNDKVVWLATDPDHAADALHSLWGAVQ